MKKKYRSPLIIFGIVTILWLIAFPSFHEIFLSKLYYMPFVGAVAAIVANITPAAAGIVYFPILTHLNVSPTTVAQFNLVIQAYGMGLGTFRWFLINRRLFILNVIPISIAGGFIGEIVSIALFPINNPEFLSLIFNFIAFIFTQIIFFSLLKNSRYPNMVVKLNLSNCSILFAFAFIGGLLCGWIGFGIDTIFYFIMTVIFGINPAASIVTSISLMAAMSISGTILNYIFHDVPIALWYSAIPGVTIAGLFLAAFIAVKMGSRNILLLFTFFLSIDFFAALWTQQTIPMSDTLKTVIILPLSIYMIAIHVKIFISQSKSKGIDNSSMGEFNPVGESDIHHNYLSPKN